MKKGERGQEKISKLSWLDLRLIQLGALFAGFFIAVFLPSNVLKGYWWLWGLLFILSLIKPCIDYLK